ncbi:MAG: hypothetical protein ABI779_09500 [Acidobacteriota bacterium]
MFTSSRFAFISFVFLAALTTNAAGTDACGDDPLLAFNASGQLLGAPPRQLAAGDTLTATIPTDPRATRTRLVAIADHLLTSIGGLETTKKLEDHFKFGITDATLTNLRDAYCGAAEGIVGQLTSPEDRNAYAERLRAAQCMTGALADPALVPTFSVASNPYAMSLNCRDKVITPVSMTPMSGALEITFTGTVPDCREVVYDVRSEQPITVAATAWAAANPLPPSLRAALIAVRQPYDQLAKDAIAMLELNAGLNACIAPFLQTWFNEQERTAGILACTKLDEERSKGLLASRGETMANQAISLINLFNDPVTTASHVSWLVRWMWFAGGRPTLHPFLADGVSAKRAELAIKKNQFVDAEAEVAAFEKVSSVLKIDSADVYEQAAKRFAVARAKRDRLNAEIANLTKAIASGETAQLTDSLLYQGLLLTGCPDVRMQHHDAKTDFKIMGKPTREVLEKVNLITLTENTDPAAELRLVQTVTAIAADQVPFLEELLAGTAQGDQPPRGTLRGEAAFFVRNFKSLNTAAAFAAEQLAPMPALIAPSKDETPALVTKLVPHDIPGPAPANVTYTIKQKQGTEEKEVGSATYRLNRLYRARFRTGLMYSMLETNKLGATEAEDKLSRHGTDVTFGVQTYLGRRRDVRNIDPGDLAFSLYSGLTTRDVAKSIVLGLGWEPVSGVTLVAGTHIGSSERRRNDPGHPVSEDIWLGRKFYAITFDADFLKNLFTIKPAS